MASISDFIAQQVKSAAGGIEIPSNIKNQVLGGLSDSILGSLTQTATKAGGTKASALNLGTKIGGTGAAISWTAAPEPTSGLLLLLGVAGLALKRKRA